MTNTRQQFWVHVYQTAFEKTPNVDYAKEQAKLALKDFDTAFPDAEADGTINLDAKVDDLVQSFYDRAAARAEQTPESQDVQMTTAGHKYSGIPETS